MKIRVVTVFLLAVMLAAGRSVQASDQTTPEVDCPQTAVQGQYSSGLCAPPAGAVFPFAPDRSLPLPLPEPAQSGEAKDVRRTVPVKVGQPAARGRKTVIYFFWGKGCPHCEDERRFLEQMKGSHPSLEIRDYEVWHNRENAGMMAQMLRAGGARSSGVPVTVIGARVFSGFSDRSKAPLEEAIKKCSLEPCIDPAELLKKTGPAGQPVAERSFATITTAGIDRDTKDTPITIPFFGDLDVSSSPLPLLTVLIAGMDSFNPCAFFVLLTLLGMLVHARSRNKMLLIGGIFVFFSGFIYFLFMAAWLNLFLVMGNVAVITGIAGCVSILIAGINIKDFFLFKQGVSLSIPDSAKPKLFDRMRRLLRSDSLVSIMIGTTVLAIVANFYELLCTAGFPMVFTRILTLNHLSTPTYYLYLVLYNIVYVVPLFIIVLGFSFTLGKQKLSEWQGRVLKLISGSMMLGLGIILLVNPALLNSVLVSGSILVGAVGLSLLVATLTKKLGH
jgi:thiol-disulfide isomerase/thioredoxin